MTIILEREEKASAVGAPKVNAKKGKVAHAKSGVAPARSDAIVTARVPREIKEQGNAVLKKIGFTPTELVNAAYQYVIDCEELPKTHPTLEEVAQRRQALTAEQKGAIRKRIENSTLKAPASWEGKSFEQLREQAMREKYPDYFE